MRVLILCHAFNSLTQRVFVELAEAGHDVSVEFDVNDRVTEEAAALFAPDVVVAPFLKRAIPEAVWRAHRCIVLHPGIKGDRGPSALDWAIMNGEREWGVTALQANAEMDAGDIWAWAGFPMRDASKASLYRNEVTEAAVWALKATLSRATSSGSLAATSPSVTAPCPARSGGASCEPFTRRPSVPSSHGWCARTASPPSRRAHATLGSSGRSARSPRAPKKMRPRPPPRALHVLR